MTTVDPTALLALCDSADDVNDDFILVTTDTVRALVAAYVERDALRAEVERWKSRYPCDADCSVEGYPVEDCSRHGRTVVEVWQIAAKEQSDAQALRVAVARMTGAEAVEAARVAIFERRRGGNTTSADLAHAAVRAIAALGAP